MLLIVRAMAAAGAAGPRHESDTFIVAHRLQIDRNRIGLLSDSDNSRFRDHFSLEPVAPTGATVPQIMQEH
jgi:hypothetical protein